MNTQTAETTPIPQKNGSTFQSDLRALWSGLSRKRFFLGLLAAWALLFGWVGNPTLGYVQTKSLFVWMFNAYNAPASEDGHGNLIPFVVIGLFWWKRNELLALKQKLWWPSMFIVALALLTHVFGFLVQQPRISIVALFLGLYGLIGLTWGPHWLKATFFPMVLFVFCIPVGSYVDKVTFPLRLFVTNVTYFIAHGIFGLTVIKKGTQLFDANGAYSYDVAAACSGIRSLISLLALTTVYGMLTFKTNWKRMLVIGIAIPLAVVSNVIRLLSIVLGAEAFGQKAGNFIHEWSGFVTYAVAIAAMLFVGFLLREKTKSSTQSAA